MGTVLGDLGSTHDSLSRVVLAFKVVRLVSFRNLFYAKYEVLFRRHEDLAIHHRQSWQTNLRLADHIRAFRCHRSFACRFTARLITD